MFASYVICSIKQTSVINLLFKFWFASYVICSIKQTINATLWSRWCLLVMLFVVLSKLLLNNDY